MDTRNWFDVGTYSDLTIKLSNDTDVKVHKVIVCQAHEYFSKLCGPDSHFSESSKDTIKLHDDDPAALTKVLRHIYKLPLEVDPTTPVHWRAWLDLRTTTDKYLEKQLSEAADKSFRETALACSGSNDIFDIISTIENEMGHDESLVEFAVKMRQENVGKLLRNDRFRAQLDSYGKEGLWRVIDGLFFAAGLREKRYHLCSSHKSKVFKQPSEDKQAMSVCSFCYAEHSWRAAQRSSFGAYNNSYNVSAPDREFLEGTAWIP